MNTMLFDFKINTEYAKSVFNQLQKRMKIIEFYRKNNLIQELTKNLTYPVKSPNHESDYMKFVCIKAFQSNENCKKQYNYCLKRLLTKKGRKSIHIIRERAMNFSVYLLYKYPDSQSFGFFI